VEESPEERTIDRRLIGDGETTRGTPKEHEGRKEGRNTREGTTDEYNAVFLLTTTERLWVGIFRA